MMIPIIDIIAGTTVLLALGLKFKYRWVWVAYALACWTYSALNFYSQLPAQGVMNIVAGLIATKNFLYWSTDSKE